MKNDPTGHFANILLGAAIGALAGAAISYGRQVVTNVSENGWSTSALTNVDGADIVASAVVGAVAGGLIGSGVGATAGAGLILSSTGTGMATSAVGYTLAAGKDYKTSEMVLSAGVGAVAGAVTGGVSNAFAKPLPLNYGGCLNESGRWAAKFAIEFGINASASVTQTVGTNMLNNRPTSQGELGYSFLFGGGTGAALDFIKPGMGGIFRGPAVEYFNNKMIGTASKNPSTNSLHGSSKKLMDLDL